MQPWNTKIYIVYVLKHKKVLIVSYMYWLANSAHDHKVVGSNLISSECYIEMMAKHARLADCWNLFRLLNVRTFVCLTLSRNRKSKRSFLKINRLNQRCPTVFFRSPQMLQIILVIRHIICTSIFTQFTHIIHNKIYKFMKIK